MKNLSIRLKITLWFSGVLVVVVALALLVVLTLSGSLLQKSVRDNLIETVEGNVDEVEYFSSLELARVDGDLDHYIDYGPGVLEVDDDFLDQVNGVYTALYQGDSLLLYGANPIALDTRELAFQDSLVQRVPVQGENYFVFDRALSVPGEEQLWLRGVVLQNQGSGQISTVARLTLIVLPLLMILAILGGYAVAGRMLRPIGRIARAAQEIGQGMDLTKRIHLGPGGDEVHRLANTFDTMFDRLEGAFETQRRFVSDASHELRTPMAVIQAQCEYSLDRERTPEEYRQAMEVIQRQSGKMNRLIATMLDFARLESQPERFGREELDLSALVEDLCQDLALLGEKGITMAWDIQPGLGFVGERQLLSRMVSNLVTNAYRYGRENGHIWVSLKEEKDWLELAVRDDGIGIEPQETEKIFRRFYQVDASRALQGAGLGLPMVEQIAHFYGGDVRVESQPGQGSTFFVRLPEKTLPL